MDFEDGGFEGVNNNKGEPQPADDDDDMNQSTVQLLPRSNDNS
jgi:hypothetical protein